MRDASKGYQDYPWFVLRWPQVLPAYGSDGSWSEDYAQAGH